MYFITVAQLHFNSHFYLSLLTKLCLDNNNRVKLLSEPGTAGSDYINGSFVSVSTIYQLLQAQWLTWRVASTSSVIKLRSGYAGMRHSCN